MAGRKGTFIEFFSRNHAAITMGITALVIAGTADLFAGLLMDQMEEYLTLIIGMMVLIYSTIGMRGNIFGAMGSRIGTAMNIGTFEMSFRRGTVLRANLESALALTLIMSIATGIATWGVAKLFFGGDAEIWDFIYISTFGGVTAGLIVMMFNILIAYVGNKRNWDVDNITAPLIAAIGDIVTMPMVFVATWSFIRMDGQSFGDDLVLILSVVFIIATLALTAYIAMRKVSRRDFSGEAKRIVNQSLPILMMCLVFEIGAGIVIQDKQDSLVSYSVLMIMMPAYLNQGNALSGMLTSRLSSMIHMGTLEERMLPGKGAIDNFLLMFFCAAVTFLYIGIISFAACVLTGGSGSLSIAECLAIIMVAGMIATLILNILSYYVAIAADRFGLDPDDHCIPITSSVMDLFGALVLVAVISMFI
ncbi:putative divalent cation transporter [Thermoplasmatales archaeon BRNA1]|nr:putative divalent cation transporter [Thermoplasmatales archaeon BRNA1]